MCDASWALKFYKLKSDHGKNEYNKILHFIFSIKFYVFFSMQPENVNKLNKVFINLVQLICIKCNEHNFQIFDLDAHFFRSTVLEKL